jgi:hypothetical protein
MSYSGEYDSFRKINQIIFLFQICVESCPQENFSPLHLIQEGGAEVEAEVKERMRPFCANNSQPLFSNSTVEQLISSHNCPQW